MISIIPIFSAYLFAFSIARDDFSDCVKEIRDETRGIFLEIQADSENKFAISQIPLLQNRTCPGKPLIYKPSTVFISLSSKRFLQQDSIEVLKNKIVELKNTLNSSDLVGAHLKEADLSNANLKHANLSKSNLFRANLSKAILKRAFLIKATAKKCNFYGADLERANLTRANLEKADLRESNLQGAILHKAVLRKAKLQGSILVGSKLTFAKLEKAEFQGADLQGANLSKSRLRKTKFIGANLKGVYFLDADFDKTDLRDANLSQAYLREADLLTAENLTTMQLCQAKTLFGAKLEIEQKNEVLSECPSLLRLPNDEDRWRYLWLLMQLINDCNG